MLDNSGQGRNCTGRSHLIGGSDARVIMGKDEAALLRLWREKRDEVEPENLDRVWTELVRIRKAALRFGEPICPILRPPT
jgi:predicted phage-related endonuclease